jgi:2-polyprenyl-3-methyl-5-hydroxy-6-metoxy-1,4-benzoquinol methylase
MVSSAVHERIERYMRTLGRGTPPSHIAKNFTAIDESSCNRIKQSLLQNYFNKEPAVSSNKRSDVLKNDLLHHLYRRLLFDRLVVIPWLDHVRAIRKTNILEIGCGTGSSTVALAEQGADITAVDIDKSSLTVARERCEIYGLDAHFVEETRL